jgi:cadmium resistance protein CadD (predicted permease)
MTSLLPAFAASVTTFAATNVDDLLLLTVFFARRIPMHRVVAGQYLGFACIVGISLIGLRGALAIPHGWIRLFGIVPLLIGVKELLHIHIYSAGETAEPSMGIISIASVTLANGADNVGVYVPFFTVSRSYLWLVLCVYIALVPVWCLAGKMIGNHRVALRLLDRYGHWLTPLVFIALGLYVLLYSRL